MTNPLNMDGPDFLKLFSLLIAIASVLAIVYRMLTSSWNRDDQQSDVAQLDPWQLAYLREGPLAVAQTAIVDLSAKKLIQAAPSRKKFVAVGGNERIRLAPVSRAILRAAQMGEGVKPSQILNVIQYECKKIKEELIDMGVLRSASQRLGAVWPGIVAFGGVIILGISKLVVGILRGKPVGYLLLLLILSIVLAIVLNYTSRMTKRGVLAMEKGVRSGGQERPSEMERSPSGTANSDFALMALHPIAIGFAAGGFNSISGNEFVDLTTLKMTRDLRSSASGADGAMTGGGCGGGDGGGGGGGCGGGGCGGCGS
ncbi:TIGR04222 domain-containing membrane protein [Pirellulaceae bacterium SH449]